MLHCHMIHYFAVGRLLPSLDIIDISSCFTNALSMMQSGQQVILLEGMEVMPPVPQELKDKPHVELKKWTKDLVLWYESPGYVLECCQRIRYGFERNLG